KNVDCQQFGPGVTSHPLFCHPQGKAIIQRTVPPRPHPEERAKPASRRTQVGFTRLAFLGLPISGKPEIGWAATVAAPSFETHRFAMLLRMRPGESNAKGRHMAQAPKAKQQSSVGTAVPNDLAAFFMPFTANRAFKARPRLIARAKDMHYYTPDN